MAEVDWGNEASEAPKKKSRVPKWAWFCGGGCLLALVVAGVLAALVATNVSEMFDEGKQLEELRAVLPFESLPEGHQIVGTGALTGFIPGVEDAWTIRIGGERLQVEITQYAPSAAGELRDSIASGELDASADQQFGSLGIFESAHGELEVQGRKLPWMRFQTFKPTAESSETAPAESDTNEQADDSKPSSFADAVSMRVMMVDLTREGEAGGLVLQFQRQGKGPPVEPSEVIEFLAPFKIGEQPKAAEQPKTDEQPKSGEQR